jgi:hypothetical protein
MIECIIAGRHRSLGDGRDNSATLTSTMMLTQMGVNPDFAGVAITLALRKLAFSAGDRHEDQ